MKEILCYGDSNTWGMIAGTEDRYPWGVRWPSILQEMLCPEEVRILEDGLAGRTTDMDDCNSNRPGRNGLACLPALLEAHRPLDGVVLMLGTNDCKVSYSRTAAEIAAGLEQCIETILQEIEPAKLLVIAPPLIGERVGEFDSDFDKRSAELSRQLYPEFKKITDSKGLMLVNAADFAQPGTGDYLHLDEAGHKAVAEGIYAVLKKIHLV